MTAPLNEIEMHLYGQWLPFDDNMADVHLRISDDDDDDDGGDDDNDDGGDDDETFYWSL